MRSKKHPAFRFRCGVGKSHSYYTLADQNAGSGGKYPSKFGMEAESQLSSLFGCDTIPIELSSSVVFESAKE